MHRQCVPSRIALAIAASLSATALLVASSSVAAPDVYPNNIVKLVVPLPPGGIADALPRILAEKLSARWGQPVIVENRPGAANRIGAEAVARAEPDGYTLLAAPSGALVIPKSGYDATTFVPVSVIGVLPVVLVAKANAPYSNLQDLIAFAKANPEKVTCGSPGRGSAFDLIAAMLEADTGIRLIHVPYQGMAPAMRDLLAGQIDMTVDNLSNVLPHIRSGKLKALAVASARSLPALPNVAAVAETFPNFVFSEWFGIVAPPKTPAQIVERISADVRQVLSDPEVEQRFRNYAVTPMVSSPTDAATFVADQRARWNNAASITGVAIQ